MQEKSLTIYQRNGFDTRRLYLENLAEMYSIDEDVVFKLADLLGPIEDFDGLVSSIEDYAGGISA